MLTKEWFFSAKAPATLILIIFPLSYMILSYYVDLSLPFLPFSFPFENFLFPYEPLLLPEGTYQLIPFELSTMIVIPPVPLLVILLIYAVYPTFYPVHKYFEKRGSENVLIEYYYIRKILFSAIIIMIIFLPISIVYSHTLNEVYNKDQDMKKLSQQIGERFYALNKTGKLSDERIYTDRELIMLKYKGKSLLAEKIPFVPLLDIVSLSLYFVLPVSVFIIIKLLMEHSRKLFKFHLAKACFEEVLKKSTNEVDVAKYFMLGLVWYNRFLKKSISLGINNIDAFYESVITDCPLDNNKTLLSLVNTFEDKNEFTPVRFLSTVLPLGEGERILTRETFATKLKESSELLIPIVTTLITIISTFFIKPL